MTLALSGTNGLLQNYVYLIPTTGFSYTFTTSNVLVMDPAGTLATGTITMPAAPADGMTITFSSTKTISSLTLAGNGATINNPITSLVGGQSASYVYRAASTSWFSFLTSGAPFAQIQPISASVAASALTISASTLTLDFRSTTLGSGAVTTVSGTPTNLVISSGSTLGTVSATQSRIVVIAMNNAGTIELAAVNISGGNQLDETNLISTTAEGGAGAADSANVIYSTTARTSLAYRVIGYIESTQATAGTWASAPSTIQGYGGQALNAMSSLGYGQTWQSVTRTSGTTYYNTTGRPIQFKGDVVSNTNGTGALTVNGVSVGTMGGGYNSGGTQAYGGGGVVIPAGASYVWTISGSFASSQAYELR